MTKECDICGDEHKNRRDNLCNSCRKNNKAKYCNECGEPHNNRVVDFCNDCRRGLCDGCRCELSKEAIKNGFKRCRECYFIRKNANRKPAICLIGLEDDY